MKSSIVIFLLLASGIYASAQQTEGKSEDATSPAVETTVKSKSAFEKISFIGPSSTAPLFVVDGVAKTRAEVNNINSNDIQSISVLRDANATERYGEKGRYGVILISMKKRSSFLLQKN